MKVYNCLICKEMYAGGAWFYRIVFMGSALKKFDAASPRELAQKLLEYFRNVGIEPDAQIDIDFPQNLRACLNVDRMGGDSLIIPVREVEAKKILTEYYLFKSEVAQKERHDSKKNA